MRIHDDQPPLGTVLGVSPQYMAVSCLGRLTVIMSAAQTESARKPARGFGAACSGPPRARVCADIPDSPIRAIDIIIKSPHAFYPIRAIRAFGVPGSRVAGAAIWHSGLHGGRTRSSWAELEILVRIVV